MKGNGAVWLDEVGLIDPGGAVDQSAWHEREVEAREEETAPVPEADAPVSAARRAHPDEESLSAAAAELDEVQAALDRLEDGSFDRCQVCGAPIGADRLIADPLLTRCPAHASAPHV